ncbi:hypothetical protein L6164_002454 [Bauhinia variegata]|uniref:Uncharacterized protein n=1 Tax=Bauhinia variegata TaxID=167791 RepID=A0ACB9Q051_BAUVA|nr:hypothetical protein L6164_002454 [Bauhinia variegata]
MSSDGEATIVQFFPIMLAIFSGLALACLLRKFRRIEHPKALPHGSMGWPFLGETLDLFKPHKSDSLGTFLEDHCSRLSSIVKEIIKDRQKNNIVETVEGGELLNVILSKQDLSVEEMMSIALDLLFGGYETTAKLLSLIVYYLAQTPNALKRLKVINEGLRCENVVKFLHRKAVQDVKFKEFVIPAGWKVLPVLSAGHLDPNFHKNPQEFNPFRWNDNSPSKIMAPFWGGPLLCPGADLARVEIAFFLHHTYTSKALLHDH